METSRKKAGSGKRAALTCALSLAAAWAMTVPAFAIDQDIVILHTNDIHCGIRDGIGYSGLAAYEKQMEAQTPYVTRGTRSRARRWERFPRANILSRL